MKTSHLAATSAAVIAVCALAPSLSLADPSTDPMIPVGSLSAFPTIVQTGTKPTLTWNINYPSIVTSVVTVSDSTSSATVNNDIPSSTKLYMDIRVLGQGVTVSSNNGRSWSYVPTQATFSYNNGSYHQIFYGTNLNVNPNTIVLTQQVTAGRVLKFGGRYYYNGSWGPSFNSDSSYSTRYASGPNVRILTNGQTPPNVLPAYNAPSLESFLKPYLNASGKVSIGPMDMIIFMELTDTSESSSGYDLQDMVLLVTFRNS